MSKYDCDLYLDSRSSVSILISKIKPDSIVLEFGPANGRMTKYLKEKLNCKVYAVEIDKEAAKNTAIYTEKIVVDSIENYMWKDEFQDIKFDYIIFADVLEHLYSPEEVLKSVAPFLRTKGSILVSIPNISHNAITIGLLKNEFNYGPLGLLDDTHIRFYTKKTFDKLISKCGYHIAFETAIFTSPEDTELGYGYDQIPKSIAHYIAKLDHGEVYQYVYELKSYEIEKNSDFKEEYKHPIRFSQIYIEDERGLSEDNSIKLKVSSKSELFKFQLKEIKVEKHNVLRFDPLNNSCIVKINKILADDVSLKVVSSNASINIDNLYCFTTDDPQINLDISTLKKIDKLVIELEYFYSGNGVENICDIVSESNSKIIRDMKKIELDLINKEKIIESLRLDLTNIYNSFSWKLIKPLRIIAGKIKVLEKNNKDC